MLGGPSASPLVRYFILYHVLLLLDCKEKLWRCCGDNGVLVKTILARPAYPHNSEYSLLEERDQAARHSFVVLNIQAVPLDSVF